MASVGATVGTRRAVRPSSSATTHSTLSAVSSRLSTTGCPAVISNITCSIGPQLPLSDPAPDLWTHGRAGVRPLSGRRGVTGAERRDTLVWGAAPPLPTLFDARRSSDARGPGSAQKRAHEANPLRHRRAPAVADPA